MTWEKFEIGNFVELRQGLAINKSTQKYLSNEVTYLPLLRIGDMKDGNFNVFINDSVPEKFIAKESDIIYTRTGKVGLVFRKQYGVIHNNCFTVSSKDESILIQEFLYYVLQEKSFYEEALSRATGAAQPDLPHSAFSSIEILLPPIDKQKNIVEILNAYNDLIENNQKQIKLLEEAAQRLYKEWFVDLRFPGYETTPIIDGVPEGWEKKNVGGLIQYEIGGGWGEEFIKEKFENSAYVIRGTDLYGLTHGDFENIPCRFHSEANLQARKLVDGDIIFEVSGGSKNEGVARTALIRSKLLETFNEPVMCASFCKLIRFNSLEIAQYMYDTFKYLRNSGKTSEFDKKSASSIVNYRWKDFLEQQDILLPDIKILESYNELAGNFYNQILCKSVLIKILKQARDRLLPKLMSGELEV